MSAAARIAENVARVREQIRSAAMRSGRNEQSVRLVAVTKYVGLEEIHALLAAGCRDLGESRPQDLWAKADALAAEPIRWHFIGHLQRNKARRTLPLVSLLHSIDSEKLLHSLDRLEAELKNEGFRPPLDALLEVNISGDESKHGLRSDEVAPLVEKLTLFPMIRICGLMGMASLEGGADRARRDFAALRMLRERLTANLPDGCKLDELSMGMSGDFVEAIEEGATIVRVGSALFEGADSP